MIEFDLLLYRGICMSLQMIEGLYQLFIFLILCFDPSYIHLFFFMLIASLFPLHQFVMLSKSDCIFQRAIILSLADATKTVSSA